MWSDYAFTADSRPSLSLALETIYAVDADRSFDALKTPTAEPRRAVIRSIRGEGELWLAEGEPLVLRPGTVILLDFNLVRRYRPSADSWRFWYFEFECEGKLGLPLHQAIALPDSARDESEARECMEALRRPDPSAAALASALFALMYHRWLDAWASGNEARHPHEDRIREAAQSMRRSLDRPLRISALALQYGMSERSFRSAFEAVMEQSPKRFLDRLRLEKGAELLRLNRYSMAQIADQVGYSSAFHFSKAFRELFGLPPSTYASAMRNER